MDKIKNKRVYRALGFMSGTSLDGVDAAVIETDGENIMRFGESAFYAFDKSERTVLSHAVNRALDWGFLGECPDFRTAEHVLRQAHIRLAKKLDMKTIDIVGFHGQTLVHKAAQGGQKAQSLQIGDGQKLANALGVEVVYDFRSNDIKNGGQGAPLVPIYHWALAQKSGLELPLAIVNIGGVANFTLITPNAIYASDSGPGNGPLDDWIKYNGLGEYDKNGALAMAGTPDIAICEKWLSGRFFNQKVPKSADRHDFDLMADLLNIPPQDGAASIAAFIATTIAKTLAQYKTHNKTQNKITTKSLIVCGGGRKNRAIMAALSEQGLGKVINADDLGWQGDALEAQAFAYLAVRNKLRLAITFPQTTGVSKNCIGGVLVSPQNQ